MAQSTKKIAGEESVHYVPPRKKREQPKPKMQPPLTPMIDVTFQLLLFFLMTFTFREAEGLIPGTLPRGDQGGPSEEVLTPIRVTVRPPLGNLDAAVYEVGGQHTAIRTAANLYKVLMDRRKVQSTDTPVVIIASPAVRWEHVVDVFSQAVHAKFKKIGFAN